MIIKSYPYLYAADNLRVTLSDKHRILLTNQIERKYGNPKRFCEHKGLNYDTVNRWITLSKNRRREPSFKFLTGLYEEFQIPIERFLSRNTAIGCGNSFNYIPLSINVNEMFCEGFALYIGEGYNTSKSNEIALSNTDLNLIEFTMRWLNRLGIRDSEIKLHVYLPSKNYKKSKIVGDICNTLGVDSTNIRGLHYHKKSSKQCLLLIVNNVVLKYLLNFMRNDIENIILNDKKLVKAFLRGYLAAEGSVYVPKNANGSVLEIGFGKQNEFNFVSACLKKTQIEFKTPKTFKYPRIRIYGYSELAKISSFGGFGQNKERQRKLSYAINRYKEGKKCQ